MADPASSVRALIEQVKKHVYQLSMCDFRGGLGLNQLINDEVPALIRELESALSSSEATMEPITAGEIRTGLLDTFEIDKRDVFYRAASSEAPRPQQEQETPREKFRRERRAVALTALDHLLTVAVKPFAGDGPSERDLIDAFKRVSNCIGEFESEANDAERLPSPSPARPQQEQEEWSGVDEEMVPHAFNSRMPYEPGDERDIWCKDCEYHRDHKVHAALADTSKDDHP